MYLPVLVEAADPPLSLEDAKAHLYVDHEDDDGVIEAFVAAATAHVERVTSFLLAEQTWQQDFDSFCGIIRLTKGPVSAVDSITYRNEAGQLSTVDGDDYGLFADSISSYVRFKDNFSRPSDLYQAAAVRVTWTAGQEEVPAPLIAAIKLIVGDLYANREAKTENNLQENPTVKALLSTYRIY